jgi:diacylglycerol kinase
MEETEPTINEKKFSIVRRAKSLTHAGRGVWILVKTTHNAWVELFLFCFAILLGLLYHLTSVEWILLILAGGITMAAEAFNTAFEIDINLTSPEVHPMARDVKDVAAGAVLITGITALLVAVFIFTPHIFGTF